MSVKFGGGSSDHFSRTTSMPASGTFSICGFAVLTTDANNYGMLFSQDDGSTGYAQFGVDSDGTTLCYYDQLPVIITTGVSLTTGTPFFWGVTKSAASVNVYFRYLTSLSMTTASGSGSGLGSNPYTGFYIGNDGYASGWDGEIWGVKVWDSTVLTAAEIYQESCTIRPNKTSGLYGWYPMVHSTVADCVTDFSGGAKSLTNTGSNTIGQGGPVSWGGSVQIPSFVASSDVTVALSGTSITISQTAPGVSHTQGLTGGSLTSAAGTVTPATAIALSGGSLTSASGAMVPVKTVPLTGQTATVSAGTLVGLLAVALSGLGLTTAQGTLTANTDSEISVALTGQSMTISAGTLGVTHTQGLTGGAGTTAAGTLAVSLTVPLVGGSATVLSGTLIATLSAALSGGSVTLSAGTVIPGTAVALSGGSVTFSTGTLTAVGGTASATITIKAGSWFRYRIVD